MGGRGRGRGGGGGGGSRSSHQDDEELNVPLLCVQQPDNNNKLSLIPLIFLIYFEVSGGPYGEECAVGAAGPLFAILGFLIFPFIWSIPEALITAELSTAFPGNGGFVVWAHQAFGSFWATLMATWKFLSGVINLASYPVLCADYLSSLLPALASGLPRYAAVSSATLLLSLLNYTGLTVVGHTAVAIGVVSYLPFLLMSLLSLPTLIPSRLLNLGAKQRNWTLFFNTLFWNLNFWDNASTLAGEVRSPRKTYPKALFLAVILTLLGYLLPLMAAIGSVPDYDQDQWRDGYLAEAAEIIAGKWLKIWIGISTVLSVVGMFEAQLTTSAYQVLGMAELGMIPRAFGARSGRFGTPWVGILAAVVVPVSISYMDFTVIISAANFVYALGMLLEFASFVWLRRKVPGAKRPFRVPVGGGWAVAMCVAPCVFLVYIMCVATGGVALISGMVTLFGVALYLLMNMCRTRMWFVFNKPHDHLDIQ